MASAPLTQSRLYFKLLSNPPSEAPLAVIILVGDISKPGVPKPWGHESGFFWPGRIENVDVLEFSYIADTANPYLTRAEAVEALKGDISEPTFEERYQELQRAISARDYGEYTNKASQVVLVGYGYGGLLCEKVIARIVVEANMKPEAGSASVGSMKGAIGRAFSLGKEDQVGLETELRHIAGAQETFSNITQDWADDRIASCFSGPRVDQNLSPEWSAVPHATPVVSHKPYLEITVFDNAKDGGYVVVSGLIKKWIRKTGGIIGAGERGKQST
ncbi:hypothetical protein GGR51DRAFT_558551 [Nemania sp. FL0031]|nr:hypothetical protein GGR51DRAFT_558551 [Nemania sp. FL0031]